MSTSDLSPSEHTQAGNRTLGLNRPRNRFKRVAMLTPVKKSESNVESFRIQSSGFAIGREADNDAVIPDTSVSRYHARINRIGNDFIIEDCESRNGTYVDGVSVISCVLRSGDEIQIGRYVFFYDQFVESIETGRPSR